MDWTPLDPGRSCAVLHTLVLTVTRARLASSQHGCMGMATMPGFNVITTRAVQGLSEEAGLMQGAS